MFQPPLISKINRKQNRGFTLLELLIASVLLALIGLAIYATFAQGVRLWERGIVTQNVERDARFALERMARDLKNTFKFTGISFRGSKTDISFPNSVDPTQEVGRVTYLFDPKKKVLFVRQESYRNLSQPKPGPSKEIATQIKDLAFHYYVVGGKEEASKWLDAWGGEEKRFPAGVKIELVLDTGKKEQKWVKTVYLPVPVEGTQTESASPKPELPR